MVEIGLDLRKSVEQNAEIYFERAKKLKRKLVGAREVIARTSKQLEKIERSARPVVKASPVVKRKTEWYEKFRWFFSSEGFLVIGGRDATTNEIVIKKHAEPDDLVFHTDMAGSPFFVVKAKDKVPTERTAQEVADATCSFSRAWKLGMTSADVFYVKPEQVTKQPKAGEYLTKGAFVIRGKTNYVRCRMNLGVGIFQNAVMAGPVEAVKTHCERYVEIVQGEKKVSDVAKAIQRRIGGDLDEIIRALPSGCSDVKK
jgi:predicted ribosome quality control (RQC) complex YloA/Tae2 family protein